MLSFSQTTGYGLLACSCLDRCTDDWLLARDIAKCCGVPLPYLSKVLHGLSGAGIVLAKRGYRGGFQLARPGDQISLLEVVEAVRGKDWGSTCLLGLGGCSDDRPCPMHDFWSRERAEIERELRGKTIRDIGKFSLTRHRGAGAAPLCGHPKSVKTTQRIREGVRR